jgi:hypothetical protein
MTFLDILKIIVSIATIGTGLLALVKPKSVYGFTGLRAEGGRGITEIRSILGGLFIALGGFALYMRSTETYSMLAVAYLGIGIVRLISMFVDQSFERSNIISLITEFVFGIVLLLQG